MSVEITEREREYLLAVVRDSLRVERESGGEGKASKAWLEFLAALERKLQDD